MHVCVCVCLYASMLVCVQVNDMCVYVRMCCICIYVCRCVRRCAYVYMYVYVYIHPNIHPSIHAFMHLRTASVPHIIDSIPHHPGKSTAQSRSPITFAQHLDKSLFLLSFFLSLRACLLTRFLPLSASLSPLA